MRSSVLAVWAALVLSLVVFSWPAETEAQSCEGKAQRAVAEAESLVGKAESCSQINATANRLKTIATECAGLAIGDHATTLRFKLLAQVCVKGMPGPRNHTVPSAVKGPAKAAPDDLVREAGKYVETLRSRIVAERAECADEGPCPAVEVLEKEQVEATVAYLQLTTRRDSGFGDARKLLVGALTNDPYDLIEATARLQRRGLEPETAAKVAAGVVRELAMSAKDSAIFEERFDELFASVSADGPGGVKRAGQLLTALRAKGISTADAQQLLVKLASMPQGVPGRTLADSFRLAAFVNDPEVLRQWKASLDWLFGKGGSAPPELRKALEKESPDPNALLDIINRMNAEQAKALVSYAAVVANREEELHQQNRALRTPRNSYIIFSGMEPAKDTCSPEQGFQSAVEEFLTQASPVGIRQPISISEQEPAKIKQVIEEALCMCRHQPSCPGNTIPVMEGRCEGVLAIRFTPSNDGTRAMGSLRFVSAPEGEPGKVFQLSEFASPSFSGGCEAIARSSQKTAAIALIRDLERRAVAFQLFPRVAVAMENESQPTSRWNALALSGLPQLRDSKKNNDTLGWTLAGVDLALTGCSVVSGAMAYTWRNSYADGSRASLGAANAALGVASGCLVGLAVERLVAALTYKP
jgi:hypothetical protein